MEQPMTKKDSIEIVKEYKSGKSLRRLAKEYGLSHESIRQRLIKITGQSKPMLIESLNFDKKCWDKINQLRKTLRLSGRMIGRLAGVSYGTVLQILCGREKYANTLAAQKVFAIIIRESLDVSRRIDKFTLESKAICNKISHR